MPWFEAVEAVLFDCDGTLVDSERLGEQAVMEVVRGLGIDDGALDYRDFHGVRWAVIERHLVQRFPGLAGQQLAAAFQRGFNALLQGAPPPLIPGAREAVVAAGAVLPAAVVSSSDRADVELILRAHELRTHIRLTVCAEDCQRSKPDPQGFLLAAGRLGVDPRRCLVFEDSAAGLRAARAAGMASVAVGRGAGELADRCIDDYRALPAGFFETIAGRRAGRRA
jgi:HAD superfamily hydrolase (TIGR01509 family)